MPYFSFFWKKHYSDIGNCCMTKPLDETTVPGTNGSRLVSYIDVSWMSDIKLKWIGWDKGGDFAWITPDGMIYRFTDLKRNERGMKYEKEVQKLELWSGGWGTDGPPENLYEWELSVQENCGFCKSTPSGKKGEKEEKEDETGDKESDKDSGVNVRDWKEFADSKPEDENSDNTRTSETTNTEHVTNTGKTAYDDALENAKGGGGGKKGADDNDDEDEFIAKLPYKDLIKLPAKPEDDDEPIYRKIPQFTKPKYQNPVLDNKKVLDNKQVLNNAKVTKDLFKWDGEFKQEDETPASIGTNNPTATYDPKQELKFERIVTYSIPKIVNQNSYQNQYGKKSTTPRNFRNHFLGHTYDEIITGNLIVKLPVIGTLSSNIPNSVEVPYDFLDLSNGKQVDMIHFLVVGKQGHLMGTLNEVLQLKRNPKSAFYQQDLYSNRLGVTFFQRYAGKLKQFPYKLAEYIYEFLSDPNNI